MKTAIILCQRAIALAVFLLLLLVQPGFAEELGTTNQPSQPLESLLKPDGTLDLTTGFSGSLDAQGWKMVTDTVGQPRFVRSTQETEDVSASAPGDQYWDNRFTGPPGVSESVSAIAVSGSDVYVGGDFIRAGGVSANHIAKWDGSHWSPLGSGVNSVVSAIAVSGSSVYVGGWFTMAGGMSANRIAKWNGSGWSALGSGIGGTPTVYDSPAVLAIVVTGNDVYVGGDFSRAGGVNAKAIAKWDGSRWSALGSVVSGWVRAIAVSGSDVYVGGYIYTAGGVIVNGIAKWDGTSWSALGAGVNGGVAAIAVSGSNVYVGGDFDTAGGVRVNGIAKWDSTTGDWSALGSGMGSYGYANSIALMGNDVYVGGRFSPGPSSIAKWDGNAWSPLGSDVNGWVNAIGLIGSNVYVGGSFTRAGPVIVGGIAKLDGTTGAWSALGSRTNNGITGNVYAMAVSGNDVYVGGEFTAVGRVSASNIGKWNSATNTWSALGSGVDGIAHGIAVSGQDVYVAGVFLTAGGVRASNVAKWNSATNTWSALGSGLDDNVYAIAASGNDVYVGGWFTSYGNPGNHVAKWDSATNSWSALGSGVNGWVNAIAVSGNDVYVGGSFDTAGGVRANNIAKWDGRRWSALGSGVGDTVYAIAVSGSNVYVGGTFAWAGGKPVYSIAKWNGRTGAWSPLGRGIMGDYPDVEAIAVSGSNVYVGGNFILAGGKPASYIAKWDGSNWSALGSGVYGGSLSTVQAIAVDGSNVYVGGYFTAAGGKASHHFGRWLESPPTPTLQSPANGASVSTHRPVLDWTDVAGATYYGVQVRQINTFGVLVVNTTTSASTYTPTSLLGGRTKYDWRVRACNQRGCSSWTGYWSFTITAR